VNEQIQQFNKKIKPVRVIIDIFLIGLTIWYAIHASSLAMEVFLFATAVLGVLASVFNLGEKLEARVLSRFIRRMPSRD